MPVQGLARCGGLHERTHLSDRAHRGDHGSSVTSWPALNSARKQGGPIVATNTRTAPVASGTALSIQWSAIIAGAVSASALAFVLHTFAGAIGLSVSSAAPTWRDASWALVLVSGLYLVFMGSRFIWLRCLSRGAIARACGWPGRGRRILRRDAWADRMGIGDAPHRFDCRCGHPSRAQIGGTLRHIQRDFGIRRG